ncbi:ATPase Na K transporting alpha [Allomyces javanicus]|nr:ATPase Na K transporting alpha [Allomyces javanicus]
MNMLLVAVAVAFFAVGELGEALIMACAFGTMIALEIATEQRAKRLVRDLAASAVPCTVTVRRNAQLCILEATVLVPGDVVLLERGQRAPADLRVIESLDLAVDEATYSGESVPVVKYPVEAHEPTTVAEYEPTMFPPHFVPAQATVQSGRGTFLVVATGARTHLAQMGGLEPSKQPPTQLALFMKRLAFWLACAVVVIVLAVMAGALATGVPWHEAVLTGLVLAFATIPEELPLMVKLVLASAAWTLGHDQVLVRRLRAAEHLGAITMVITDKTGTLTENRLVVECGVLVDAYVVQDTALHRVWALSSIPGGPDVFDRSIRATTAPEPADVAAWDVVHETPLDPATATKEITRRDPVTGRTVHALRGAPERLVQLATHVLLDMDAARTCDPADLVDLAVHITPDVRRALLSTIERHAAQGLRLVAFGLRGSDHVVYAGCVAFRDAVRPAAHEWIKHCHARGVHVVMATGDHSATALAVARAVGIPAAAVHSRMTPAAKLALVEAAKQDGHTVAFIGDGANDGAALAAAHVGVVMAASPVVADSAVDAADVICLGTSLAGLVRAMQEGRRADANLRKAVAFYLGCKAALVALTAVTMAVFGAFPFSALQLIVLEISMDVGATTLFMFEPADKWSQGVYPRRTDLPLPSYRGSQLDRQPSYGTAVPSSSRGRNSVSSSGCSTRLPKPDPVPSGTPPPSLEIGGWIAGAAVTMFAAVLIAYVWGVEFVVGASPAMAQSLAFTTWLLAHVVLAYSLRSLSVPLRLHGLRSPGIALWLAAVIAVLGVAIVLAPELGVTVPREALVLCVACSMLPLSLDVVREVKWRFAAAVADEDRAPLLEA